MSFNLEKAKNIASCYVEFDKAENGLVESFSQICAFLSAHPDSLSWRGKIKPSIDTDDGLKVLAEKYFAGYRGSDFPVMPRTVPDQIVKLVMQVAYGHLEEACSRIEIEHQQSMSAENCVGALLERYLDSVLRPHGWHWCCGNFVKAIDFIKFEDGRWFAIQIKNRDNTENSSSSAIRVGASIEKWFRTFSATGATNWDNLPERMIGFELSEEGFRCFVRDYLQSRR